MKIAAIIAEYNPFHNGHSFHMKETKKILGDCYIICLMSGNFVQRGEPAIADKWLRTQMALQAGADMVLELPFLYATQSAEGFALGAVEIVDAIGCVDYLSFGSETGELSTLQKNAEVLLEEPPAFQQALKKQLNQGHSYPQAREFAMSRVLGKEHTAIVSSNDILAIEYLKALMVFESHVKPICIKRRGSRYQDESLTEGYSSATAIRKEISEHGISGKVLGNISSQSASLLENATLTDFEHFFRLIQFKIRSMDIAEIAAIYDVAEGLEYRIKSAAQNAKSYWQLVLDIKSKRYTYTRIARILLYCLFDVTDKVILAANGDDPLYARVLGIKKQSEQVLSLLAQQSNIPVLTKSAEFIKSPMLKYDVLASDVYGLLNQHMKPSGRDYTQRLIVVP